MARASIRIVLTDILASALAATSVAACGGNTMPSNQGLGDATEGVDPASPPNAIPLCGRNGLEAFPRGLSPEPSLDYLEQRTESGNADPTSDAGAPSMVVRTSREPVAGAPCAGAGDRDRCNATLESLPQILPADVATCSKQFGSGYLPLDCVVTYLAY